MKLRPLHDRVLVRRLDAERKSAGGILIPDTAAEKPAEGMVVAVGPGKELRDGSIRKIDLVIGDRVLFGKYGGTEVKIDGELLLVVSEDDIMAVVGTESVGVPRRRRPMLREEPGFGVGIPGSAGDELPSAEEGGSHGAGGGGDD